MNNSQKLVQQLRALSPKEINDALVIYGLEDINNLIGLNLLIQSSITRIKDMWKRNIQCF